MRNIFLLSLAVFLFGCGTGNIDQTGLELGDFGAFYTRLTSDQDFEKFSRVRAHPDIVVDLGKGGMTFNFWRGSSYLPYLQTSKGKFYVDEIIERKGDGTDMMPDRNNTFSHVQIISNSEDEVVVHWRYLPDFSGDNPKIGVTPYKFVDEYFYIKPNGSVRRTIQKGTERIDAWRNQASVTVQLFKLSRSGIKSAQTIERKNDNNIAHVKGVPAIETTVTPNAWWKFDEGIDNNTIESVGGTKSEVMGNKTLWRKGVSGTALQFDGYFSEIRIPANKAPELSDAITLESWVVLGAYPWSDVPLVQQLDDNPEELERVAGTRGTKRYRFIMKEENDRGYFLGIDGYGHPVFKVNIGGDLQQVKADVVLDRRNWYHLTATYDNKTGYMKIYVDGEKQAAKKTAGGKIMLSEKDIRIGKGKDRRPIRPVRQNTFADSYSLDGMIDEVKIYDVSLSEDQVADNYKAFTKNESEYAKVDMDKRSLPAGEDMNKFGAYYTHLKYYDVWDNLWRFGDHPDVVVEFDENPSKFIFWRGTGYIPMMVNDKGHWYSNEFNETWGTSGGKGCQEPMSDKEAYTNHARILENTPARVVVHWRYPLLDVNHVMANYDDATGWCDWSDWYYYIYPDGIAVKSKRLWTHGNRNHEWQESMGIFGPDQHPEEVINTKDALTMINMKGDKVTYDWVTGPPPNVKEPEGQCIQYINYTGDYKPVTIGDFQRSNVYGGELTEYSVFPTWNHWPASQMPSDGRYATYPDRMAHSSLTHVFPSIYKEEFDGPTPFYEKLLLEGMLNEGFDDLVVLAKSWMQAPEITDLKGAEGDYVIDQRAYILDKQDDEISFSIAANPDNPIFNLAVLVRNWDSDNMAKVSLNGNQFTGKQGVFRDTDGSKTLALWIETKADTKTDITIK